MKHRSLSLVLLLIVAAVPLSASQFIDQPFDQTARNANLIVRGQVVDSYSAWDSAREVIYTYSTVRVTRYFGETTGPDTVVVRNVGGEIDGYRQEAVGFPELRNNEHVVLMLERNEDGADYRIHAYNQGKFLVRHRGGVEVLISDPVTQGAERLHVTSPRFQLGTEAVGDDVAALGIDEFARMVEDARAGSGSPSIRHQQQ
ncbi:MAG: hypothetical protein QOJ98_1062 [Acidobacteriota bacterium]|jgi:RecJ-like exonuclease|nr:hypothetical protein [Acidobacteriota bacterium]